MLVLTRRKQETIRIGNDITITVVRIKGKSVRLGIEAPKKHAVLRGELTLRDENWHDGRPADQGGSNCQARGVSRRRDDESLEVAEAGAVRRSVRPGRLQQATTPLRRGGRDLQPLLPRPDLAAREAHAFGDWEIA
jgi:carbon storage regulator CsrA